MIRSIIIAAALATSAHCADVVLGRIADLTWGGSGTTRIAQWGAWTPASLNPVAWYKGDGNALDSSGNGYHGTWSGTEAYTNGVNAQDFYFNGSSWVDTGTNNIGGATLFCGEADRWSIAVWFKVGSGSEGSVIARAGATQAQRTFQVFFQGGANTPHIVLRGGLNPTSLSLDDGAFHHIVLTWDGTTAKLYKDGAFAINLSVGAAAQESAQRVIIGARTNGDGLRLTGAVGDVIPFNRALTQSEITQIYNYRQP